MKQIKSLTSLISESGKCQDWESALLAFSQIQTLRLRATLITYNAVISACEKGHQTNLALDFLVEIRRASFIPDVISYNSSISACQKQAQWELALDLLQQMGPVKSDIITYSAVISACGNASQWEYGLDIFRSLHKFAMRPNVITFNAALSACDKGRRWEHALVLFGKIRQNTGSPSMVSYNTALSACEKGHQWERGMQLLGDALSQYLKPTVVTYNSLISACEKSEHPFYAFQLLQDMRLRKLEPDLISHNAVISSCEKGKQWAQAISVFSQLDSACLLPDSISCRAVMSSCEKGLQWELVLVLLDHTYLRRNSSDSAASAVAVASFARASCWSRALTALWATGICMQAFNLISYLAVVFAAEVSSQAAQMNNILFILGVGTHSQLRKVSLGSVANPGSSGLETLALVANLLRCHGCLVRRTDYLLQRHVFAAAFFHLHLAKSSESSLHSNFTRIHDPILERRSNLSGLFIADSIEILGILSLGEAALRLRKMSLESSIGYTSTSPASKNLRSALSFELELFSDSCRVVLTQAEVAFSGGGASERLWAS